jgi:hypothetical protein
MAPRGLCQAPERMQPWTKDQVQAALKNAEPFHPFPAYHDRGTWEEIKKSGRFSKSLEAVTQRAKDLKGKPLPPLSASLYLDFQRTGERTPYQNLLSQREDFLQSLALAECPEASGDFLDSLMDTLWAFCEESDWCYPAHTTGLVDMERPHIDLRSSRVSAVLAAIDAVFGDALPDPVRKRIRYELDRRTFDPYLSRDFGWMKSNHNWNAVCNGSVLRAALLLVDDREKLARIILRAQHSMCAYLDGFDEDGGTAEGIAYWEYGFSNYTAAAYLLNLRTKHQLNLFEPPLIKEIARFPMRVELSPGKFPSFADGGEEESFSPGWVGYLADELGASDLRTFVSARSPHDLAFSGLDSLLQLRMCDPLPPEGEVFRPAPFNFLKGVEWMISRASPENPDDLVLAAIGGNNGENHNHNDIGNIIIHYRGESLVADLGAPVYDKGFFSSERYTYLCARSLGHSVPLVNGCEQRTGKDAAAVFETTHTEAADSFRADITTAYPPEADLASLVRKVSLHRDSAAGSIEMEDVAAFNHPPKSFENALITFCEVDQSQSGKVTLRGEKGALEVEYDAGAVKVAVQEFSSAEAKLRIAARHPTVRRVAFEAKNSRIETRIRLEFKPVEQ